ncbi:MAG: hypothetical protein LCH53_11000 [Bacteroidetes bacterium]|nr:hypothetical protein [Bacteroidota bacterium]
MQMGIDPNRWEHGSDFHLEALFTEEASAWWEGKVRLASGRDALLWVLLLGRERYGWTRVWLPSYNCEVVLQRLVGSPFQIRVYEAGPEGCGPTPNAEPGDVLVRTSYFGWGLPPLDRPFEGATVEDHTHDPWAATVSSATFAVASLRKTLPLSDGGVAWSPSGVPLPLSPALTPDHARGAARRQAAMALKRLYLAGAFSDKEAYRGMAVQAEAELGQGALSGMTGWSAAMANAIPLETWRETRAANGEWLASALEGLLGVEVIRPPMDWEMPGVPLGVFLRCRSAAIRQALRDELCAARIYPAVLWPVGQLPYALPEAQRMFSDTTLMLHVDARYARPDLERVAQTVRSAVCHISNDVFSC